MAKKGKKSKGKSKRQKGGTSKPIVVMNGGSWLGDQFHAVTRGLSDFGNWVKDNKIVSRVLTLVPDARAKAAGQLASQIGLGMKGKGNTSGNLGRLGLGAQPQPTIPL